MEGEAGGGGIFGTLCASGEWQRMVANFSDLLSLCIEGTKCSSDTVMMGFYLPYLSAIVDCVDDDFIDVIAGFSFTK